MFMKSFQTVYPIPISYAVSDFLVSILGIEIKIQEKKLFL